MRRPRGPPWQGVCNGQAAKNPTRRPQECSRRRASAMDRVQRAPTRRQQCSRPGWPLRPALPAGLSQSTGRPCLTPTDPPGRPYAGAAVGRPSRPAGACCAFRAAATPASPCRLAALRQPAGAYCAFRAAAMAAARLSSTALRSWRPRAAASGGGTALPTCGRGARGHHPNQQPISLPSPTPPPPQRSWTAFSPIPPLPPSFAPPAPVCACCARCH